MSERWLLHPHPKRGESLVSWVARLGDAYKMSSVDFADNMAEISWERLATGDVPEANLRHIARMSGQTVQRLTKMVLPAQPPWNSPEFPSRVVVGLLTSEDRIQLPLESRFIQEPGWNRRGCRICMSELDPYWQTLWDCTLISSCLRHGVLLETFESDPRYPGGWREFEETGPIRSGLRVLQLDRRTMRAIRDGFVQLPGRTLDAVAWFKLLECAMADVVRPAAAEGRRQKELIAESWRRAGIDRAVMVGRHQAFDKRLPAARKQVLAAAAELIELVGKNPSVARGALAATLSSPGYRERSAEAPATAGNTVDRAFELNQQVIELLEETIHCARTSLPTARAIFGMLCSPEFDEVAAARAIEVMRNELHVDEGVIARLLDSPPSNPFAPFLGNYIGASELRPWTREVRHQPRIAG